MAAVLLTGLVVLAFAIAPAASGKVIYYDNFDGAESADLDGTVPDVTTDDATWVAGANFDADGTVTYDNSGMGDSAYLPFVPEEGFVYTLAASISTRVSSFRGSSGTNDWIALGFTQSNENPDSRFYDDNGTRNPIYWAMTRTNEATQNDQTFVGPGTGGYMNSSTISADNITIVLDTTVSTWTISWYYNGLFQRTENVAEDSKTNFQYIAFANARSDGTISSFRLEDNVEFFAASNPDPVDEAPDVPRDLILNWKAGELAEKHNLFIGTDFSDVNDATVESPLGAEPQEGIDVNSFDIGRLEFGTTYYWRVDEVNSPSSPGTYKGNVWSFTVEPVAYKVPVDDIIATASSSYPGYDPNDTINESGLNPDNMNLHSGLQTDMWLSGPEANAPWIRYDFDRIYQLHQMMVWNYNLSMILVAGFRDVTVEYSLDGESWTEVPDVPEFAMGTGTDAYKYNTVVDFNDAAAKSVRLTANTNWGMQMSGLSEVRFTYIPVWAREPRPADGAADVPIGTALTWRAGREAGEHNVYIGTDEQAVTEGSAPLYTVAENSYSPELRVGQTYYWRVDEVNDSEIPAVWQGDVWNFTAQEYIIVDDFEDYNDTQPYTVWDTWIDGLTNSAYGGSQMGNEYEPFCEQTIVHGGNQSAPLNYKNTSETKSEVVADTSNLAIGSDWSAGNANTLVIWFRGDPNNTGTNQLYAKLNDTKILYDGGASDIVGTTWKKWEINIASMAGVDLSNISSVTIGLERIGAAGGEGVIYLDDIELTWIYPYEAIGVENFSFELPGTEKIKGWDGEGKDGTPAVDVPGWSSDSAPEDSGVEEGTPTDGLWTAFLKGVDPAVWQLTDHVIAADESIALMVDAMNTGGDATTLEMSLYYDDNGTRVPAAVKDVTITGSMQEYSTVFNAADAPEAVGKRIGIEFNNVTANGQSWIGLDNVRLRKLLEP